LEVIERKRVIAKPRYWARPRRVKFWVLDGWEQKPDDRRQRTEDTAEDKELIADSKKKGLESQEARRLGSENQMTQDRR
jgi:hypothetical protein